MHIKQLSNLLDSKIAELDARVTLREKNLSECDQEEEKLKLQKELTELAVLRDKLVKSKDLALEAHTLERLSNKKLNQRKAFIGLGLCVIGGLTALVLIFIAAKEFFAA